MAKRGTPPPPRRLANLSAQQIEAAIPKLERRLGELEEVQLGEWWNEEIRNRLDGLQRKVDETLVEVFGPDTLEYKRYRVDEFWYSVPISVGRITPADESIAGYQTAIADAAEKLRNAVEMLREKLDDPAQAPGGPAVPAMERAPDSGKVFVVHGHDEAAKQLVARFLERIGLEPIILHEQISKGLTIIEKVEQYSDVAFAVVILTPDDVGASRDDPENLQPRARQNVWLELGYFIGKLGRERVVALKKGALEVPTDYLGAIYIPMDEPGAWKIELAKEMKGADLAVDFNKVVMA